MSTFDWPANLVPKDIQILPPRATQGLTTSLNNFTQVKAGVRPPFTVTMEFDELFGSDVLAWRAFMALLEGRANTARLPLFDLWYRASDAAIGAGIVGHNDGSDFADLAGYSTSDVIGVTATGVQGQRTIAIDFGGYAGVIEAGQYFGIDEHPYVAGTVTWAGSVATIRCSPTLRKSYTAGTVRLRPTMIGRLASDDGGALMLRRLRHGAPTITFNEDFAGIEA